MTRANYHTLKKEDYYLNYSNNKDDKMVMLFRILDSKPVKNTFTIINVLHGWRSEDDNGNINLHERKEFVSTIQADSTIYTLSADEFNMYVVLAQI